MAQPTYTISASGEFVANLVYNDQCGKQGASNFAYEAELTVNGLDERGFVCDVLDIGKIFATSWSKGKWEASCELLANGALTQIIKLCQDRAIGAYVKISPASGRFVRVDWKPGQDVPILLPRRRDGKGKNNIAIKRTNGTYDDYFDDRY